MRVLLLNFEGGPESHFSTLRGSRVPLLNFEGGVLGPRSQGPGSRSPGPTFTPCCSEVTF